MGLKISRRKWLAWLAVLLGVLLLGQTGLLLRAEILAIRLYQVVGSPIAGRVAGCRFEPT